MFQFRIFFIKTSFVDFCFGTKQKYFSTFESSGIYLDIISRTGRFAKNIDIGDAGSAGDVGGAGDAGWGGGHGATVSILASGPSCIGVES